MTDEPGDRSQDPGWHRRGCPQHVHPSQRTEPAECTCGGTGWKAQEPRKLLMAPDLMEQWATRDSEGRRLSWDWGEPDADGFYTPAVTVDGDDRLGVLDAAWREAEAALPDGWGIEIVPNIYRAPGINGAWVAIRVRDIPSMGSVCGSGPTPAAALHALTVRLRERA